MIKILNWTLGACFRTLGRFLAIFIVFVLLLFVGSKLDLELPSWLGLKVNATTVENWSMGLNALNEVFMYDCTGPETCSNSINIDTFNVSGTDRYYVETTGTPPLVYTNGITIQVSESKTYQPGYLYSVNMYLCGQVASPTRTLYSTYWGDRTTGVSTDVFNSVVNVYSLNSQPFANTELNLGTCYAVSSLFSPSKFTTSIMYRVKSPNQSQRVSFSVIGLKVDNLGVYDKSLVNQIENIIDNSGYATAESVEEVNQAVNQVQQEVQELNNSIDETNNTIKDDDTSGAEDSAIGFFNDFTTETFGLTSIITAPLNAINSLINSTCNNLVLPLPYVEKNLILPCMNSIYSNYFKGFFDLYQIITTGLISYYIIVRIFNLVKDFKNPEHDEIEVMDL